MESPPNFLGQECTNFKKSSSHFKLLGASKVKRSKVCTEEQHILGATKQYLAATLSWWLEFVIVIVIQKSSSHFKLLGTSKVKRSKVCTEEQHILGATKQYLAATLSWCPEFVIVIDFHIPSIQSTCTPGWRGNGKRSNSSVFLFILHANVWERAGKN